jgi:uncharacterized protein YoxC
MKVITLAIICVVLAAGLVGVIAVYGPNSNLPTQITNKDNTISQLQQQVDNLKLQTNITTVMEQYAILEQNLTEENALVNSYSSIANMTASATPVSSQAVSQDGNTSTVVWNDNLSYAGYITVQAQATSNTTYAETIYSNSGVNFDQNITLGTQGTAAFPIVPGQIEVEIGNLDSSNTTNTATVTIEYYY